MSFGFEIIWYQFCPPFMLYSKTINPRIAHYFDFKIIDFFFTYNLIPLPAVQLLAPVVGVAAMAQHHLHPENGTSSSGGYGGGQAKSTLLPSPALRGG